MSDASHFHRWNADDFVPAFTGVASMIGAARESDDLGALLSSWGIDQGMLDRVTTDYLESRDADADCGRAFQDGMLIFGSLLATRPNITQEVSKGVAAATHAFAGQG